MGVTQGVSDLFPQVCVVYTCPCGRRALRHGRETEAPAGWILQPGSGAEPRCVCAECADAERRPQSPAG